MPNYTKNKEVTNNCIQSSSIKNKSREITLICYKKHLNNISEKYQPIRSYQKIKSKKENIK